MKKITVLIISLMAIATSGFAEKIVLDNQTTFPNKDQKSKIAVQFANSVKEVQEGNQALMNGSQLNQNAMQVLTQNGKINLNTPSQAQYFRVLVWSKGDGQPDLVTNWVDIVPKKTYKLEKDHLVPTVLMAGTGC